MKRALLLCALAASGCQLLIAPDGLPAGLQYATSSASYSIGEEIPENVPSSTGAAVERYAISPSLPAGLRLDPLTGVISGTPAAVSPATTYTVTATNDTGSTIATIELSVSAGYVSQLSGGLAAGGRHTCALVSGMVLCWGANDHGQLGNGTYVDSALAVRVSNLTGALAVVAGENHSCALLDRGVFCWGADDDGQLGDGPAEPGSTTSDSAVPVAVRGLSSGVTALAAGGAHTCALMHGGAFCWGDNRLGWLGVNRRLDKIEEPSPVSGLSADVEAIAAGKDHTCAVVAGAAWCWGANGRGQLGTSDNVPLEVPTKVDSGISAMTAIAAGEQHTCVIAAGILYCWGDNQHRQISAQLAADMIKVPTPVPGYLLDNQLLAAGAGQTCVVAKGAASCWGKGSQNSLQDASVRHAQDIVASGDHACALVDGWVQCWGANDHGQLGDGTHADSAAPVRALGLTAGVQGIAAGADHTCAIVQGGVQCWGANDRGQLGGTPGALRAMPDWVPGLAAGSGVQAIGAGGQFTCALKDGGVRCWGKNESGTLGIGSTQDSSTPVPIENLQSGVQSISAGLKHACAVRNGEAWCWGANDQGQLGDNTTNQGEIPVKVALTRVQRIAAAYGPVTCATSNGAAQCWGWNVYGQLGTGSTSTMSAKPVPVSGPLTGVTALSGGVSHMCAVANGGVRCWGTNAYGQLGYESPTVSGSPSPGAPLSLGLGAQLLTSGYAHNCVVMNGRVQCWGYGGAGELGNNDTAADNLLASDVHLGDFGSAVTALSARDAHTCAISKGIAWCWGSNKLGQLGNGGVVDSPLPVQVESWKP